MLPRSKRVPPAALKELIRRGSRVKLHAMELAYAPGKKISRFACVVPVRVDKRSTARNRMKRLIREAVRQLDPPHTIDGVFMVRNRLPDAQSEVTGLVQDLFRMVSGHRV